MGGDAHGWGVKLGNGRRGILYVSNEEEAWHMFRVSLPDSEGNIAVSVLDGIGAWDITGQMAEDMIAKALGSARPKQVN